MIDYKLIRRDQKRVTLRLDEYGNPVVRAPKRMPKRDIDAFVERYAGWIEEQRRKKPPPLSKEDLDGLKRLAASCLPPMVEAWAKVMGVTYTEIRYTTAKSYYGRCRSDGRLTFSCRLMRYPAKAITYIVVHELAHRVEMNHSPAFYRVVGRYLPDWKERRALLGQNPDAEPEDTEFED